MSIFTKAANAANPNTNEKDYLDYKKDTGSHVFVLESNAIIETKVGTRVVIKGRAGLVDDERGDVPSNALKVGDARTIVMLDPADASVAGQIRAKDYKAVITCAFNVPVADERAAEACDVLVDLLPKDACVDDKGKPIKYEKGQGADFPEAVVLGIRNALIESLMVWASKGEAGNVKGRLIGVTNKKGKESKKNAGEFYTDTRFEAIPAENAADIRAAILGADDTPDTVKALLA